MPSKLAVQMTLKQVLHGKGSKVILEAIRKAVDLISKRKCKTHMFLAWVFGGLARGDEDVVTHVGWPSGNMVDVVKEAFMCASPPTLDVLIV
jgi:hypothetical protein